MVTTKSAKIWAEMEKVKAKISDQQAQLKELKQKHKEAENEKIIDIVRGMSVPLGSFNFRRIFQTITVDNGSEFQDWEGMTRAVTGDGARTHIYYCHPYSAFERGSNENGNRMIRRKVLKGTDYTGITEDDTLEV